ncbi:CRISPR-associated helicase Cas3' [Acinetobacter sp. B10A]|uniref:CRISPR-associated helicase Cas3' n=1 Tax=Acinetobacter baretiae TaxID=2605383 RepID=UPI001B3C5BCE|nr:CRISPR-associated helicase Cas3' [Acinetobacter baretiae]MBF7684563.1 CRISPR-associated helicase Cas3' [Acinetobacter baretiae]
MIVTFISQCEKKAIPRTRQILDAFANRIGSHTWQTVITEEGLLAVKRLLLNTVSKNTAVACHKITTRRSTALVWIVGNRSQFNSNGIVPVNYTTKELFMDLPIETKTILANSSGQPLSQHLFSVGYLAYYIIEKLEINNKNLAQSAFITGILHDIGKLDPQFQQWLSKKSYPSDEIVLLEDGVHIDTTVRGFKDFSFENHPRHNEISWLLAESLLRKSTQLNTLQCDQIFHGVYWHHTRPYRKDDTFFDTAEGIDKKFKNSLKDVSLEKLTDQIVAILKDIQLMGKHFSVENLFPQWSYHYHVEKNKAVPKYKIYSDLSENIEEFVSDVEPNALHNLVRMAVISADRIVSAMTKEDLNEYLAEGTLVQALDHILLEKSNISQQIQQCIDGFNTKYSESEQNKVQDQASSTLAALKDNAEFDEVSNVAVLQGPAGCGKTKISLEWALKTDAQKIIWVCPRVQVCLGILHDLTASSYLPHSRIEILTGEYKKILQGTTFEQAEDTDPDQYFTGDIVITTIDQVINNIISHHKVTGMINFMQSHIIFDEFHELIVMPAFNLFFAELIAAKKLKHQHANTLLVSATPHDFYIKNILKIDPSYIVRVPSFNQADYQIEFVNYDETEQKSPLITQAMPSDKVTFVISNTAQDAQLGFLLHQNTENSILLHSKYTKVDKSLWFNRVFESFKHNGSRQYHVLRSGPIVQASLNISCERMYTDLTSAENWLQRLGRLDRFDKHGATNIYTTIVPKSAERGKQSSQKAKFLATMHVWQSAVAWLLFLKEHIGHGEVIKIKDLYAIYQLFYTDSASQKYITEDLQKSLRESVSLINQKVLDPVSMPSRSKKNKDGVAKIANISLRGDNRFVQLAVCEVSSSLEPKFLNEYAYAEQHDHTKETIGLTESVSKIQGGRFEMRDSNKNLLAFMHSKHHNVMKAKNLDIEYKKSNRDWELLKLARSPEYPIYLSYTPLDLEPIGGEKTRHSHAMYYVKTKKQPVGMMSIDQLIYPQVIE